MVDMANRRSLDPQARPHRLYIYREQKKRCQRGYNMATIYVSHAYGGKTENLERAKKITHDLQVKDLENCYICPLLAFSHLGYNEIGYDEEIDLCLDLMSVSDKLIVASDLSKGVCKEIDFANLVGMEVQFLEDTE
jgi:hypothetical protein